MAAFRMGKLTTMPVGLICASVSVHVAKEEESRKQLVKPEQVTSLQNFVNFVKHKCDAKAVKFGFVVVVLSLLIKNVFEVFVGHVL